MIASMVLAAGLGTRLRPLTDHCAKSLVPVGDRPMVAHVLERLLTAGVSRVVVNCHHRLDEVRDFFRSQPRVTVSEERELLGTAGGVAYASEPLGEGDVLVWNADILADVDLPALLQSHTRQTEGARESTLVVQRRGRGEGNVGTDEAGRIVRLRQVRVADEAFGGEFLGIHVIGAALRSRLPARGCLVGDVYLPALRSGAALYGFPHSGPFFDVGTLGGYLDANVDWLETRRAQHWAGAGVHVESGVILARALVGEGARVLGSGVLARCVVWPGATAIAPLQDAVVMRSAIVPVGR
ncbi:MAG TPA: sugar phosphate nucleotidyltransferase [Polyangiaceae bacterium]|nr:sugar phosphate nucleotidyltransferase [Polyangiaceae bacterium]